VRFYLHFCNKYGHQSGDPGSLPLFIAMTNKSGAAHKGQPPACFPQARFRVAVWVFLVTFIAALNWQTLWVW
jgi:hypothetical protein